MSHQRKKIHQLSSFFQNSLGRGLSKEALEYKDHLGRNKLHQAALNPGQEKWLKLGLEVGVDLLATDVNWKTALEFS